MKPTYLIIWSAALLLIGCAIGTFWFHDVLFPPMQVTDTTDGEWHGVVVKPAIVAASKVPQDVIAQTELTINIPAQHEWAVERGSNGISNGNYSGNTNRSDNGSSSNSGFTGQENQGNGKDSERNGQPIRTFDFLANGGGWFTSEGEIYHNPWDINIIIQAMQDGSTKVLTDEPGVTFTVKSAVAVKPQFKPRWTLDYEYGFNGTHTIMPGRELTSWLAVKGGVEFGAVTCGQARSVEGKVGGELRF